MCIRDSLDTVLEQADTPQLREHDRAVWTHTDDGEQLDVLRAYTCLLYTS